MDIALNISTPSTATHLSPPTALGLDEWPLHTVAEVVGFASPQSDDQANTLLRLLEVGFLPGERVRLTACGLPGRDPLAVRVGQSTFALRRHEAALIQVAGPGTSGAAAEAAAPGGVPSGDRA